MVNIEETNGVKYILKCIFKSSKDVLNLIQEISNFPEIEWCEPEMLSDFKTNNPLYPQQYYLKNTGQNGGTSGVDINVEPAWNITNGTPSIIVAIIDCGVDRDHEDMGNRVLDGFTIRNPNGLGIPQNINNLNNKAHGTSCVGIVGASNNTIGVRGIASNVNILPVNIVPDFTIIDPATGRRIEGFGTNIEIARAINWAWRRADVLSCSWGGGNPSNDITLAIDSASNFGRNGLSCPVIFSSGNDWGNPSITDVAYPGNIDGVITVGAINNTGVIYNYSQRGASMDLVAPSGGNPGNIVTTDRMGDLGYEEGNYNMHFNGTSAACPQVAGVAALMFSVNPDLTEVQVRTTLQNTARDLGASGFDNTYGYGLVNAFAAVNAILPTISGPSELCYNQTDTFSVNLPTGATVSWQTNGLSTPTYITNSSFTASPLMYAGTGYVRATVTIGQTVFTIQKDLTLNGYVPIDGPDVAYLSQKKAYFTIDASSGIQWRINGVAVTPSIPNRLIVPLNSYYPGSVLITCTVTTSCGTFEASKSLEIIDDYEFLMYPNPATDLLTVSLASPAKSGESTAIELAVPETVEPYSIQLWNERSGLVKTVETDKSTVQIPLHGLPKGMYYVHVKRDKNITKKQILWIK